MMCHAGFGGVDPQTNEYYCFLETFAGGYGGRDGSDGPDAVQTHGQNTENAPVEETELNYPVRVARLSLVDDSDGAGRFRVYWQVCLPLVKGTLVALGIFTFLGSWNDLFWPLIVLSGRENLTLPAGLAILGQGNYVQAITAAAMVMPRCT